MAYTSRCYPDLAVDVTSVVPVDGSAPVVDGAHV